MKWRPSEPSEGEIHTEIPDKMITWAHNNGKTVRGHALLWAKRSNNPDWVQNLYGEDLKTAVFNRLDFAVNHYEQYNVPHWDVINEMVNEGAENHTFFLDHTGDPNIRAEIFKYVKELSPDTLFFVNDYGIILNNYGRFPLYQQQIRELLAAGTYVVCVCHFFSVKSISRKIFVKMISRKKIIFKVHQLMLLDYNLISMDKKEWILMLSSITWTCFGKNLSYPSGSQNLIGMQIKVLILEIIPTMLNNWKTFIG